MVRQRARLEVELTDAAPGAREAFEAAMKERRWHSTGDELRWTMRYSSTFAELSTVARRDVSYAARKAGAERWRAVVSLDGQQQSFPP